MTANSFRVSVLVFWFRPERVWQTNIPPKIQPLYSFQSPQALKISPTELSTPLSDTLIVVFSSAETVRVCKKHQHRKKTSALDQIRVERIVGILFNYSTIQNKFKNLLEVWKLSKINKFSMKI